MKNVMTRQEATQIIIDAKHRYEELGKRVKWTTAAMRNCDERLSFLSNYCFDEDDKVPGLLAEATKKDMEIFFSSMENKK